MHHVGVLGILLAIHGVLLLVLGGFCLFVAIAAPMMLANVPDEGMYDTKATQTMIVLVYGFFAVFALLAGFAQLLSGIRLTRFRGRVFGIVSISMGVVCWFSLVCAMTGIPLMIYGFVVLLNRDVIQAFELAKQGKAKREILAKQTTAWRPENE